MSIRPLITGDDPTMYFQRLSRDGKRGIIIPKRPAPGPVTIKPKGLLPKERYIVSFQESDRSEQRSRRRLDGTRRLVRQDACGRTDLSESPIASRQQARPAAADAASRRQQTPGGEHGLSRRRTDLESLARTTTGSRTTRCFAKARRWTKWPREPSISTTQPARTWRPVTRFARWTARATSRPRVAAKGPAAKPAQVFDDAAGGGIKFGGEWKHENNLLLAHDHTLSASNQKGASAELDFNGRVVLVFSKLGADCGKVAVALTARRLRWWTPIPPTTSGACAFTARNFRSQAGTRFGWKCAASTARARRTMSFTSTACAWRRIERPLV